VFKRRKSDGSEGIHSEHDSDMPDIESEAPEQFGAAVPAPRFTPATGAPGWGPAKPSDGGLGVPPFRPAAAKEPETMTRAPTTPLPPAAPLPPPPALRPPSPPATFARAPGRDLADRRTLVVGRGISLQGTVQDAERLVVEGTVEASTIQASELSISHGGLFKGEIEVEEAEIAGTIDGTLIARASLVIRNTGRVLGTARCRRLQVEDGGQISGRVEMITDPVPRMETARLVEPVG